MVLMYVLLCKCIYCTFNTIHWATVGPPNKPFFKFCLSYNHQQPALKILSYVSLIYSLHKFCYYNALIKVKTA